MSGEACAFPFLLRPEGPSGSLQNCQMRPSRRLLRRFRQTAAQNARTRSFILAVVLFLVEKLRVRRGGYVLFLKLDFSKAEVYG
jgi:hypothetical protein